MGLVSTLVVAGVALAIFAIAMVISRRPATPGRPRMVPWVGVQMVCILVTVVMFAHLVSIITGAPLIGRQGY